MVDRAMEPAVSPAPNSYERQLQRAIVEQKQAYADAQTDAARQQASSMAEFLRSQGSAGGMDLSGYGSDVSLADAYKNLYSQQAQEIMGALQGQYSMNSNKYYTKTYNDLRKQGYSVGRSKRVAGNMAREYQANRVAYLNGVYNSYGHDGLVTNNIGNQIVGMLSMENPTLANFYATIYPNAKDAYKQQNTLESKAIDQQNHMAQLEQALQNSLTLQDNAAEHNKDYAKFNSELTQQNQKNQYDLAQRNWESQQEILKKYEAAKPGKAKTFYEDSFIAAKSYGMSDEQAAKFAGENTMRMITADANGKSGGKNNSQKAQEQKMTEKQQELFNQSGNLLLNARNSHSDDDIAAFEEFVNENGTSFSPAYYQRWKDTILALKGYQCKLKNDDNGATTYWS